jgi:hypothetical protein
LEFTQAALKRGLKAEIGMTTLEDIFIELVGDKDLER